MNTHPLRELSRGQDHVIEEVVQKTSAPLLQKTTREIEEHVTDSLFWERKRLESSSDATDPIRDALDQAFWKDIGSQLLNGGPEHNETVRFLLKKIIRYHAEEISGNFNDKVYKVATAAVPRGMGWLLQSLSWKSIRALFAERVDLRRKVHLQSQCA